VVFKRPGEGSAGSDGYKCAELEGVHIVLSEVVIGSGQTKFSDGETKEFVDALVLPLDGPFKNQPKRSRLFGGYLVPDLRGLAPEDQVLARMVKGAPKPGMRPGWFLEPVEDEKVIAQAEKSQV